MSKPATDTRPAPKPAPKPKRRPPAECCDDRCISGAKNRYYVGKRLTPAAFKLEQDYLVERRRLLNRAIHGWGVVYGYAMDMAKQEDPRGHASAGLLEIGPGLALDQPGRELFQPESVSLSLSSVTLLDDKRQPVAAADLREAQRKGPPPRDACWLLCVHYAERPMAAVAHKDPCSCEAHEWDQVCETVHYTLQPIKCEQCCVPQKCELDCGCASGPCCDEGDSVHEPGRVPRPHNENHPRETKVEAMLAGDEFDRISRAANELASSRDPANVSEAIRGEPVRPSQDPQRISEAIAPRPPQPLPKPEKQFTRGGCRCLCDHLMHLELGTDPRRLCEIATPCGPVHFDLHNGVPLACVTLDRGKCEEWIFKDVYDACGPRRLVKRNDLLFDLIRGCDLTTIVETGFGHLHRSDRPVPFEQFNRAFGAQESGGEVVTEQFWVRFSRPVRVSGLRPDAFVMTVIHDEEEGGWRHQWRVPIVRIKADPVGTGDPSGHTRKATLVVDGNWLGDAVRGRRTIFDRQRTWIEVVARGDRLIDCNGQRVASNIPGPDDAETGNGTPGNDAVWTFTVEPRLRPGEPRPAP